MTPFVSFFGTCATGCPLWRPRKTGSSGRDRHPCLGLPLQGERFPGPPCPVQLVCPYGRNGAPVQLAAMLHGRKGHSVQLMDTHGRKGSPPPPSRPLSGGRYGAHQNAVRTHLREAILQMGGRDAPPTRSPGFLCMARRYPLRPPSQVSVGCPRCLVPCRGPPPP